MERKYLLRKIKNKNKLNFKMLHFNVGLILRPHVAFERRVNFETPPLSKKGEKAFIILMKCCFQKNIDVLLSIARLKKSCNAPFCKSKMQHE